MDTMPAERPYFCLELRLSVKSAQTPKVLRIKEFNVTVFDVDYNWGFSFAVDDEAS